MVQQGFLARWADALNLVQRGGFDRGGPLCPVRTDGPAVSLIAQALEIPRGITLWAKENGPLIIIDAMDFMSWETMPGAT